jgi:hypothetical protein
MNFRISILVLPIVFACDSRSAQVEKETLSDPTVSSSTNRTQPKIAQSTAHFAQALPDTINYRELHFFPKNASYTVIATLGAAFRQRPDSTAEVIERLPYGTQLTVVERMQYDTLTETISKRRVAGIWVKMRVDNHEGFIFSADVMSRNTNANEQTAHFFLNGEHCNANFDFRSTYRYYAVYMEDSSYHLKKVQPAFYVRHEIPEGVDVWEWFHIETDRGGKPLFIFGMPKVLKEEKIISYPVTQYDYYSENDTPDPIATSRYTLQIVRETKDSGWAIPEGVLLNKQGNRVQKFIGSQILFCGDLDQDGIADLMYLDTNEKEGGYNLALSSYAEKGMFLKAVGYYQLGYCC